MEKFSKPLQIRWSDIDANRHLRHSVYYDYGAAMRMMFLSERGLTTQKLEEFQIGPILFREEALFKREIRLEDNISIDIEIVKTMADFSRWSLRHNITKADGTLAAVLNIDGAWIDMAKRKLAVPNEFIQKIFSSFPKSPEFELIVRDKK
jgi:acyl-CoA thioester hydrolase